MARAKDTETALISLYNMNSRTRQSSKLTGTSDRDPTHLLASPNVLDWEKRMSVMGASPNAFALSLNAGDTTALYDYPVNLAVAVDIDSQPPIGGSDPLAGLIETRAFDESPNQFDMTEKHEDSDASSTGSAFLSPLERYRTSHERIVSHRESERRRRESQKNALSMLESLVMTSQSNIMARHGQQKRLSHAEIYRLAHDMIVVLKTEVHVIQEENQKLLRRINPNCASFDAPMSA